MRVTVVVLSEVTHGSLSLKEGAVMQMEQSTARDLERAGHVRIRLENVPAAVSGKEPDDGQGRPSSALQAAQVVPPQTVQPLKRGPGRPRKTDESS
jgi:hypothetical protein